MFVSPMLGEIVTNTSSFYLRAFFPEFRGGRAWEGRRRIVSPSPVGLLIGNCCVHVSPELSTTEEGVDINKVCRVIMV